MEHIMHDAANLPQSDALLQGYVLDEASGCWHPQGERPSFAYSDGDEVEARIHRIVAAAHDLSSYSVELRQHISDWPSRYHLSPARANLLRPFAGLLQGEILEVGAGCGAITRYLGECGGRVLAVEGSAGRAAIAAARCRDLGNVTVVADSLQQLTPVARFDVVTLIGVLEYARKYFPAVQGDPVDALLSHAKRFLKPGGTLVIAIENQLGLKYFAGFGEDHVGEPMFGIEDRYTADSVVTFGRAELAARLHRAGMASQRWWFPFPDYKMPSVLLSDTLADGPATIDAAPIIGPASIADPQMPADTLFSLERAWRPVLRNKLAGDLANSFLVLASDGGAAAGNSDLAYYYAVDRKPEYAKQVVFGADEQGRPWARQERLFPAAQPAADVPLSLRLESEAFVEGQHWLERLKDLIAKPDWSHADLAQWAAVWFDAMLSKAGIDADKKVLTAAMPLPGNLIDAIPRNLIVEPDGTPRFIDQEWDLALPIELGFLLFRGICLSLLTVGKAARPAAGTPRSAVALFTRVAQSLGVWVVKADVARYCEFESNLQAWASGIQGPTMEDVTAFELGLAGLHHADDAMAQQVVHLTDLVFDLEAELSETKRLLAERDGQVSSLTQALAERDERMADSMQAGAERHGQLASLEQSAAERDAYIGTLTRQIVERDAELASMARSLSERDMQIAGLNQAVVDVHAKMTQLSQEVAQREGQIAGLSQTLVERDERLATAKQWTAEEADELDALRQELQAQAAQLELAQRQAAEYEDKLDDRLAVIAERDLEIVQLRQAADQLNATALEAQDQIAVLQRSIALMRQEMLHLSDWASRMHTHPMSYALKKHGFQLARSVYRSLPIGMAAKGRLKEVVRRPLSVLKRKAAPAVVTLPPARLPATVSPINAVPRGERDVLVFSVIDWHFRFQRPQHLARSLAKAGRRVFFLSNHFIDADEAGYQVEPLDPELPLFQIKLQVRGAPAIYFVPPTDEAQQMLATGLARLMLDLGITSTISLVQHAYWYPVVRRLPNTYRVYDCMDHHEGFGNVPEQIVQLERQLMREADLVVVTSAWLEEFAREFNRNVALVRNAGEYAHFAAKPPEIYVDAQDRKIIGYYGAIAEWFDIELVSQLARQFPQYLFLLIGDDSVGARSALASLPNVTLTGEVPYASLPYYVHAFSVCLLPFKQIPLTLATNPVKVYEYLSAGKPVVSVDLPEIRQFGDLVWRANGVDDFVRSIKAALGKHDAKSIQARKQFGKEQTWDHRAGLLNEALTSVPLPKISVIVLTFNNLDLTKACLQSLLDRSHYPNLEIIVVDNASSDDTPAYLTEFGKAHPDVKIILNPKNVGFAAGNNVGLAAATGDYLVILNNDTVVSPGWAMTMMRHLLDDPSIGLIGPVTNNIGNEAKIDMSYADPADMPAEAMRYTLAHMGSVFPLRTAAFFCAMLPRSTYEKCGPLCEDYGLGFFEDDDYCRRVEAAGLRVVCADDVFIHHHLSASFNKLGSEVKQALFDKNKAIYESKWGSWVPHVYRQEKAA